MAAIEVTCPSCGKAHPFSDIVPFRAECDACSADLHVCIACRFFDRYVENECREDSADPVAKKDRANLCEYFKPQAPGQGEDHAAAAAKARLAAMFGGAPSGAGPSISTGPATSGPSAADEAKRKLEELFKKK